VGDVIPEQKHRAERMLSAVQSRSDHRLRAAYRRMAHAAHHFDEQPTNETLQQLADLITRAQYETRIEHDFTNARIDDLAAFAEEIADLQRDGLPEKLQPDVFGTEETEELLDRLGHLYGIWQHKEFKSQNRLEQ